MRKGLVIADTGPIISLAIIDKLNLLTDLFDDVKISEAVWKELTSDESKPFHHKIRTFFEDKVQNIIGFNNLTFVMDFGESESVILYKELNADFLLIDDKKARNIAENFDVKCIGTIGLLFMANKKKLIQELKPLFINLIENNRYYSVDILNDILKIAGEELL